MKLHQFITAAKTKLAAAGLQCADPLLHSKQLAELALGIDTTRLYLRWDDELTSSELERLETVLGRRLSGEPFQYIAGYEWFWDSRFAVGPGVLIPRRETECLVEVLLREPLHPPQRVAELGPGSGNIGIAVLRERPDWEWHGFELNPETLPYLSNNCRTCLPPGAKYHIHAGDFFSSVSALAPFDWIVANPPYVAAEVMPTLSTEVQHEPRLALDGGVAGLEILARLARGSRQWLKPNGRVLWEIGSDQSQAVHQLLSSAGFKNITILPDYAGLPRVALAGLLA